MQLEDDYDIEEVMDEQLEDYSVEEPEDYYEEEEIYYEDPAPAPRRRYKEPVQVPHSQYIIEPVQQQRGDSVSCLPLL